MIADSTVLASPWQNDSWLSRENLQYGEEAHESTTRENTSSSQGSRYLTSGSCSPSLIGSDCSEDLLLNDDDSLQLPWDFDNITCDIMQHTMMNILGDAAPSDVESEFMVSLDVPEPLLPKASLPSSSWSQDLSNSSANSSHSCSSRESEGETEVSRSTSAESVIPSAPSSPLTSKHKHSSVTMPVKCKRNSSKRNRKWCELSTAEQVSLVEDLTTTISQQLGLREQLEVISIIKPDAAVSQADTEFVIELSWINEKTLQQVNDYLDRHQHSSPKSTPSKSIHQAKTGCINDGKVNKRGRRRVQQELRGREKKEQKQVMKEEKSGLFVKEQVLSLDYSNSDADDDVDILS